MPSILFVCPTYAEAEHHGYTRRAVRTFLKYTPDGHVLVMDDASPGWTAGLASDLTAMGRTTVCHFEVWGGLTRSWNAGLRLARDARAEYVLCSNNDVVFTEGWYEALVDALRAGFHLAGPVSNAPGITSPGGVAEVRRYAPGYSLTDDQEYLDGVARQLRTQYTGRVVEAPVNGFAMLARTDVWWSGAFDADNVFRPRNDVTSRGFRNPTPLMTCNEDELQGRWAKLGRKSAVVPGSFVFHYRSVARGQKYAKNQWLRVPDPDRG